MPDVISPPDDGFPPSLLQWYHFYGVTLRVSAPASAARQNLERAYCAFRVPAPEAEPAALLTCSLDTDATGRGRITLDGVVHRLAGADPGNAYALSLLLDRLAFRSRAYLFLHAAAVAVAGKAVVLAGASGHGKSTLGRALAARGAALLCDDTTPLEAASGAARSFNPQAEGVAAPTPGVPVAAVFLLDATPPRRNVHLALDRLPPEWAQAPPWGNGTPVTLRRAAGHWELAAPDAPAGLLPRLEAACHACGVTVLRELGLPEARFSGVCQLTPITPTEALPRLVAHLLGRGGRPLTELTWALASALQQARFWQLRPGTPERTAEVVLRAAQ